MCPFNTDTCGKKDAVLFKNGGDKDSLSLSLQPGDVCVYSVKANCGVPAFKPKAKSYQGLKAYSIDYEDWDVISELLSNSRKGAGSQIVIPI